eukprot:gene25461-31925_t
MANLDFALGRHRDDSSVGKSLAPGQFSLDLPAEEVDPVHPQDSSQSFINIDAANYQKHLEQAMNFYTKHLKETGGSSSSTNTNSMVNDEAAEGSESESDNEEDDEENYNDSREAAVSSSSSSPRRRRVPKMALVNGHFRGATPVELSRLTRVELTVDSTSPRDFLYSPHNVTQALLWLQDNNPLWEGKFTRPTDDDDYEGLDPDLNGSSGNDGHAVNPNAPPSNMTDVLLTGSQDTQDLLHQVEKVVNKQRSVMTRANGEFLRDYETDRFLQLAFVNLFPYGRGGPEPNGSFGISSAYLRHLLCLGCQREFQQSPNFIFYAYSWQMRNRASTISYLATRNGEVDHDPVNITVAQAREFIEHIQRNRTQARFSAHNNQQQHPDSLITETKIRVWLNRLQPYTQIMPGTEMYMMSERRKLLSMVSSPLTTTNAMWAVFYTEAQPDMYLAELYDNAVTSARSSALHTPWHAPLAVRRANSDKLNKKERAEILRDHPLLSARLHAAQQTVFWKYVIHGKHRPFGKVLDFWRRVEFQEKGTPHSHNLINIATNVDEVNEDSLLETGDVEADGLNRLKVLNKVREISTALLQPRADDDFSDLPTDEDPEMQSYIRSKESNQDVQYLATKSGGAEYVSKYASKTETAECKALLNASSRLTVMINALVRKQVQLLPLELDMTVLEAMDANSSAIIDNARTQLGRRDAYYAFYMYHKNKFGSCPVDFYAFVSIFKTWSENKVYYRAMRKAAIISLAPHIPIVESSERACYALLLFHTKWDKGEAGLVPEGETAQSRYFYLKSLSSDHDDCLPSYVTRSVSKRMESDAFLADTGNPDFSSTATVEEFSELLADENEELDTPQQLPDARNLDSITPDHRTPQFDRILKEEMLLKAATSTAIVPIRDIDSARDELDASVATLNKEQLLAYQVATHHISGEGGTGKSRLISDITKYTQILYGKTVGYHGSVLKTAPTGGAAFNIKGSTWHSALGKSGLGKHTQKTKLTDRAISGLQKNLNGTVVFILDEISLLSSEDLSEISFRLCTATGNFKKPFGGLHTILAGDFYQMKTINGTSIVDSKPKTPEAKDGRAIWLKLTNFVQLTINVRAQASNGALSPLAEFTKRVRVGDVSNGVLDTMNERVVNSIEVAMRLAHPQAVWIRPQTEEERMPVNFGDLEDHERELPVVLVQMDGYDDPVDPSKSSFPYSCHSTVPRIVPLVAVSNSARLKIEPVTAFKEARSSLESMSRFREPNASNRYTSSHLFKRSSSQVSLSTDSQSIWNTNAVKKKPPRNTSMSLSSAMGDLTVSSTSLIDDLDYDDDNSTTHKTKK